MSAPSNPLYHLAPASELRAGLDGEWYTPARFALDGFVHCSAGVATTLAVANDYFANLDEPLLLLALDPARVTHEIRHEAAAPIAGGGRTHLAEAAVFPHVYGPLDRAAITGAALLERVAGRHRWPTAFERLDRALERLAH